MFITFEGIEGSGKGTTLERLHRHLEAQGRPVLVTREPGGSELGRNLRGLLLDARNSIAPEAELFLYLADRAQHAAEVIRPALAQGRIVLSDRYADSTVAYQGYGRGLDIDRLHSLNESAVSGLWPDLTLLLDVDAAVGLERARSRNAALGMEVTEGRFEAESLAFHNRVRSGYLDWAQKHPHRFRRIDSSRSPDEVFADVLREVQARL